MTLKCHVIYFSFTLNIVEHFKHFIHTHTHIIYTYIHTQTHTHYIYTQTHTHIYICIHVYTHIDIYVYIYICICVYIYVYMCVYIYTHTFCPPPPKLKYLFSLINSLQNITFYNWNLRCQVKVKLSVILRVTPSHDDISSFKNNSPCLCKLVRSHAFVLLEVFQILVKMNSENIFAKIIIKDYAKLCQIVSVRVLLKIN